MSGPYRRTEIKLGPDVDELVSENARLKMELEDHKRDANAVQADLQRRLSTEEALTRFDPRKHYFRDQVDKWMSQVERDLDSARMYRTIVEESAKVGKFPDVPWLRAVMDEHERRYADARKKVARGPA